MSDQGKANYEGYHASVPGSSPVPFEELSHLERLHWDAGACSVELWLAEAPVDEDMPGGTEDALRRQLAAVEAERDSLRRSCRLLGRVLTSQARSLYGAWIEINRGDREAAVQWILDGIPDVDDCDPGDQWNGTETADEWFERTRDDGDAPKPQAQAVSDLRAVIEEMLDDSWGGERFDGVSEGLRAHQARVDDWRKRAGLAPQQ